MKVHAARIVLACLAATLTGSPARAGQGPTLDRLVQSRHLYESAEYDRALAVMETIDARSVTPDVARDRAFYRALCFLALNMREQAEAQIELVLGVDPLFVAGTYVSPRVRAFVDEVRTRLLPTLAQQHYRAGRALFDSRNFEGAIAEFALVRQLSLPGRVVSDDSEQSDLSALAAGFIELSRRSLVERPPRTAEPSPAVNFVPPVTLYQDLPVWPKDRVLGRQLTGILEVVVTARGDVGAVSLIKSIDPVYDILLVSAARQWKYRPATRDGKPVAHVKRLAINVGSK
jgi:hypothetical protein